MGKRAYSDGEIELSFKIPKSRRGDPEVIEEIDMALSQNGIVTRGNMTIADDGDQVVVYGDVLYVPHRDHGTETGDRFVDRVVDSIRREVRGREIREPRE